MGNRSQLPNFQKLDEYIKLYPKMVLLIDEYSMISAALLNSINDALIKTTNRPSIMGGSKPFFLETLLNFYHARQRIPPSGEQLFTTQ